MSAFSTLHVTRSEALQALGEIMLQNASDEEVESLLDKLLHEGLRNVSISYSGGDGEELRWALGL